MAEVCGIVAIQLPVDIVLVSYDFNIVYVFYFIRCVC